MEKEILESVNKRLGVLINIFLRNTDRGTLKVRDQVEILNDLGLKPKEIAEILGKSQSYVGKELVSIRRNKKR